jgi:hypothetical protein
MATACCDEAIRAHTLPPAREDSGSSSKWPGSPNTALISVSATSSRARRGLWTPSGGAQVRTFPAAPNDGSDDGLGIAEEEPQ